MSPRKEELRDILRSGTAANDKEGEDAPNTIINYYYGPVTVHLSEDDKVNVSTYKSSEESDPAERVPLDSQNLKPSKSLRAGHVSFPTCAGSGQCR